MEAVRRMSETGARVTLLLLVLAALVALLGGLAYMVLDYIVWV
jgi:hypothetical protein